MSEEQTPKTENTSSKPKKDWKALEVGAIWQFANDRLNLRMKNKEGKEIRFVCFKNKFKDPDNREDDRLPTWRVYRDDSNYNPAASEQTPKKKTIQKTEKAPEKNQEEFV